MKPALFGACFPFPRVTFGFSFGFRSLVFRVCGLCLMSSSSSSSSSALVLVPPTHPVFVVRSVGLGESDFVFVL